MNLPLHRSKGPRRADGFTMVELAMCIGIVAFAMVAILGVLPLGLGVQRQNREETIVEQEGPLWVDLIRRGGIGWDEVTKYVDSVVIEHTPVNGSGAGQTFGFRGPFYPASNPVPAPGTTLTTPRDIVSLLSIPRFEADRGIIYSNRVTAICRSFSGDLNSQIRPSGTAGFQPADRQLDDALKYQMQVDLTPAVQLPSLPGTLGNVQSMAALTTGVQLGGYLDAIRLDTNLVRILTSPEERRSSRDALAGTVYNLRLTFRWPVFRVGNDISVGPGQRVFSAQIVGKPRFAIQVPANPEAVFRPGTSLRPRRFDDSALNRNLTSTPP